MIEKYKQYWLKITNFKNVGMGGFRYSDCEISIDPDCRKNYSDFVDAIHVVQYEALLEAQEEIKKLNELVDKAVECLKFYGDTSTMNHGVESIELPAYINEDDFEPVTVQENHFLVYGKQARQTLSEIESARKKEV